jgi:hypothetical protein
MLTAPTMGNVKSEDGTGIAYDRYGQGPPVIVVGGAVVRLLCLHLRPGTDGFRRVRCPIGDPTP